MAEFTEQEKLLLDGIHDSRLKTSLSTIREALEDIWNTEAPRIVHEYTDHGVRHSERIVEHVNKLLKANDGKQLSSNEVYLLLASIYLHDIGMQCDVVKYTEIKSLAEKLGAKFNIEFHSQQSDLYSIEEQKAVRKNHNYLSAAWIDYAYKTSRTVLGVGAKSIPDYLVDDLMDICLYHSKLTITHCPLTFKLDPTERKQFVASLLRFADELDIDANRVSIQTVKTFNLTPQNAVFWWLHNQTKVIFITRNLIQISITLNTLDYNRFGALVYSSFIHEFQIKNKPVITILAYNGIPIVFSGDSKVIPLDRVELLPPEITESLQVLEEVTDPVIQLANEVRTWLRAIRYEVTEPQRIDARTLEMIAVLEQGTVKQKILVRCVDGEILLKDVSELDNQLDRKTPQGWIITQKSISLNAQKEASSEDGSIELLILSAFLSEKVWGSYFNVLTSLVENSKIPDLYVDLKCHNINEKSGEFSKEHYSSLDSYIDIWLREIEKNHISILGDFGSGKTWFCRHYAYRQLQRYLKDPVNERLPLLLTLRSFAKAMSAQQLINDALLEQYRLPFFGGAYDIFQEMNQKGKLLLILDGFDEMARQVDYQTVVDNFWELAKLVSHNSKVILTSRTEYFRWAKESEKILGGEEFGRQILILEPPKFEVIYITPFNEEQIRQVIIKRLGPIQGIAVSERILKRPNLAEMANKPILVELLLAALDEARDDILENQAQVYLYATNKLLLRNITADKTFTSTRDKIYFLSELAWEMINSGNLRIHYTDIPKRIETFFGEQIKDQHELDMWDFDLRNQTLLHRDAAGYYEFAHKSLAEYFVAYKLVSEINCLDILFTQTYCEADGSFCQVGIPFNDIVELSGTFGSKKLTEVGFATVLKFAIEMIDPTAKEKLWHIIMATKGKTPEDVKYIGGNTVTLLSMLEKGNFTNKDLSSTILMGAKFEGESLNGTNLRYACLRQAQLDQCDMRYSDISYADLADIEFSSDNQINSISWSQDGRWIAAAGTDPSIRIWDCTSMEEKLSLNWNGLEIWQVSFSPKGNYIAAIGRNNQFCIWDTQRWKSTNVTGLRTYFVTGFCWSKDEQTIFVTGTNGSVSLIDVPKKIICKSVIVTDSTIHCIDIHPEGTVLAIGTNNGKVLLLDSISLELKEVVKVNDDDEDDESLISAVKYSLDGKILLITSQNNRIMIWDTETQKNVLDIFSKRSEKKKNILSRRYIHSLAMSPDNKLFSVPGASRIRGLWNITTMKRIHSFTKEYICTCFSPDGKKMATGMDNIINIWDLDKKYELVNTLAFNRNFNGMKAENTTGLDAKTYYYDFDKNKEIASTLFDFFLKGGADLGYTQPLNLTKKYNSKTTKIF